MLEIIELILWYTAVSICFILMVIFYNQYRKREIAKPFFLGLTLFMITYGVARLIENIRRYSIGSYNDIFDAWVAGTQITGINFILRFLYYAIAWTGISVMFLEMEKFIFKGQTKYIIGILSIVEGVVSIINYFIFNPITYWAAVYVFMPVVFFIPIIFLNLARKTPKGPVRRACVLVAFGLVLVILGVMIDLPEFAYFMYLQGQESPEMLVRITAPILLILGATTISIGFYTFFPK